MGGENPDWLPADWKVSVKIRSFGRKDKYYIHSSSGLTFNSKPEVLRYLKSSRESSNPNMMNKMNIKKTVAEKLPPGWIKEIRTKTKKGKTRSDPYYIDPVSGHQFRSMQEVFLYLKSKDSEKAESEPDDRGHTSTDLVDSSHSSSAEAEGHRSIDKSGKSIRPGRDATSPKNVETQREDDTVAERLQNKLAGANIEERQNGGRRLSMRLSNKKIQDNAEDHSFQSDCETAAGSNTNIPGTEQREKKNSCTVETLHHENPAPRNKRKSMKTKWMNNTPRRTSKRLARSEVDQSVEVKTSEGSGGNDPETDTSVKSCTTDSDEQCRAEIPTDDQQKEAMNHETLSTEEQKSIAVVSRKDEKLGKHFDSSLEEILMDPCIEFAIKTLTGAIPIEDVNKSDGNPVSSVPSSNQTSGCSSLSPFGDIWSDPCFEFAVKTLTGEMPAEDCLQVQITHEKPLSSSGGSVCPSNHSFTQSTAEKKAGRAWHPPFAKS